MVSERRGLEKEEERKRRDRMTKELGKEREGKRERGAG